MNKCGFKFLSIIFFASVAFQAFADEWDWLTGRSQIQQTIYVDVDAANFRWAPYINGSTVMARLPRNARLKVINKNDFFGGGTWYYVSDGRGHEGWISANVVSNHPTHPSAAVSRVASARPESVPTPKARPQIKQAEAAPAPEPAPAASTPPAETPAPPPPPPARAQVQAAPAPSAAPAPEAPTPSKRNTGFEFPDPPKNSKTEQVASGTGHEHAKVEKAEGCLTRIPTGSHSSEKDRAILASIEDVLGGTLADSRFVLGKGSKLKAGGTKVTVTVSSAAADRIQLNFVGSQYIKELNQSFSKDGSVATKLCVAKGMISAFPIGTGDTSGNEKPITLVRHGKRIIVNGALADTELSNEVFVRQ
jgi:hypothetical protein